MFLNRVQELRQQRERHRIEVVIDKPRKFQLAYEVDCVPIELRCFETTSETKIEPSDDDTMVYNPFLTTVLHAQTYGFNDLRIPDCPVRTFLIFRLQLTPPTGWQELESNRTIGSNDCFIRFGRLRTIIFFLRNLHFSST